MDFSDTPEEAAFRVEARTFLRDAAADYVRPPPVPFSEEEFVRRARDWLRVKAKHGFGAILWPRELGGRGGTAIEQVIFEEEEGRYYVPNGPFVNLGMRNSVPTILYHGDPEQIEKFAGPTMRGELAWCQLFSEPGAGSDLAALRTRAVKDGDNWIVNGQKVWSSWAHYADWGVMLARTDSSVPKHKGITFFLVDMKTPGIDIRPIRQMSGKSDFNETFLTDVVIPDSCRLGPVNGGWAVAMSTLTGERLGGAAASTGLATDGLLELSKTALATVGEAGRNPAVREKIARWRAQEMGLRNFRYRLLTKVSKGQQLGAMASLPKAVAYRTLQDLSACAMDLDGVSGLFEDGTDPLRSLVHEEYIWSSAMRIAGGTDEVLRNQLAERVLGLPQDVRTDKNTPFDQLPG